MTDRQIMQQALEALEETRGGYSQNLIAALRERLAQPEPPVLTGIDCSCGKKWRILNNTLTASEPETVMAAYKHQTYAAYKTGGEMKIGVVPEQEQKPVAWMIWTQGPVSTFLKKYEAESEFDRLNRQYPEPSRKLIALYTTPPRREWVGLTRDEVLDIEETAKHPLDFARSIEAKLREKNNG